MKKTVKSMVTDAMDLITTYSVDDARELHGRDDVQFIDIRDVRELGPDGALLEFDEEREHERLISVAEPELIRSAAAASRGSVVNTLPCA